MKQRYKLFIEFKGTRYSGWQIQPNAQTVEGEIEKAFSQILRRPVDVVGQGRTDSGVHAEKQVAHADINPDNDIPDLLYALRGVLPKDIAVWKMQKVSGDFHARFDAKSRKYRYQIVLRPTPLLRDVSFFENRTLNIELMKDCAGKVKGTHNFDKFSKANKDQQNSVCTVDISTLEKDDFLLTYRVRANRFVHHTVRRLVGTMLEVGKGKMKAEQFEELLEDQETDLTSTGIAGKGLILENVDYCKGIGRMNCLS